MTYSMNPLTVSTIDDTSTTCTLISQHYLSVRWSLLISTLFRVSPSQCTYTLYFFIFKNKRTGHEKTLEKWVKGCYHSATKIKGAFDWVSLVINTKVLKRHNYGSWKEGIVTVGTSVFLWHYLLPSQAFSGIIQLGSIHFTCECLRKGPCVSERVDHPSSWKQ